MDIRTDVLAFQVYPCWRRVRVFFAPLTESILDTLVTSATLQVIGDDVDQRHDERGDYEECD